MICSSKLVHKHMLQQQITKFLSVLMTDYIFVDEI